MKVFGIQWIWIGLLACGLQAAEVRIATYNVRNYVITDRQVGNTWRPMYPKPEVEKTVVREVILDVRPDILVLQEIGSVEFLEELRSDLNREGLHYPYAVHMAGPDQVRHVAMLSMLQPSEVKKHKYLDFKYLDRRERVKRGLLEVSFIGSNNERFTVFGLHLKSRWTEDKEDPEARLRRIREAETCRNMIVKRTIDQKRFNYLIAGDFNAFPRSAPLRRFYVRGKLEIGSMVPAFDSRGAEWTYYYKKHSMYQTVDGFVASPSMMEFIKNGQGTIVDQDLKQVGSDHRMVYMDLVFKEK